jgi:molybdate transport system regulatory protein
MSPAPKPTAPAPDFPRLRLRVDLAPGVSFGPGKAALLEGIADTGSIAAAGRRLNMSYKRAWQLVETLNRDFAGPLVHASRGGSHGGGASLTPLGTQVLEAWRALERTAQPGAAGALADLSAARAAGDQFGA